MPARTAKKASARSRPAARGKSGRAATGINKPVKPDSELAAVVGAEPLPRTQVVKKIWDYIKAEGLQDEKNRRMINADDKLKPLFNGKKKVSMFDVATMISAHVH
jgi:chromatin remodeling complex protein RSC6